MQPSIEQSIATTLLLVAGLWLFMGFILIPCGRLVSARLCSFLSTPQQLLLSFGFSSLFYASVAAAVSLLNIPPATSQIAIGSLTLIFGAIWIRDGYWKELFQRDMAFGFLCHFLLVLLCMLVVAFPVGDFRDVAPDTIMQITGLPIDNLLPYHFSRYVVEHISTNAYEIVPHWGATDRGPLGALVNSAIFFVLGLKETEHWLVTTPGLFFVYQVVIVFLNALALFGVYVLTLDYFGKRAALFSLLLLCSSYFFLLNVLFTWPKFFMGYLFLCAMVSYSGRRLLPPESQSNFKALTPHILCGAFFAAAALAHDAAFFCFLSWVGFLGVASLYQLIKTNSTWRSALSPLGIMLVAYLVVSSPWMAYKQLITPSSPRLLYMHLICDQRDNAADTPLSQAFGEYLKVHSFSDLVRIRIQNLTYPFQFSAAYGLRSTISQHILYFLNHISIPLFFQIYIGVGLAAFIGMLLGIPMMWKSPHLRITIPYLLASYGGLFVYAAIGGCENITVSHVWAYPTMLATTVLGATVVSRLSWLLLPIYAFSLFISIGALIVALHFQSAAGAFMHISPTLALAQISCGLILFGVIFLEMFFDKPVSA